MENDRDKAARYRERAQQLRAVAGDLRDEAARKVLLATASDYETMASEAERATSLSSAKSKSDPPPDI